MFSWVRISGRSFLANAMNASSANTASQNRRRSASSAKFHELHDLVHSAHVADEVADEPAVRMPAECGPAW